MTLTVPGRVVQPLRCIVSRHGEVQADHPVFQKAGGQIHLLVTEGLHNKVSSEMIVHQYSLGIFIGILATNFGVKRLHCEGGGQLIRELAVLDAVDEFHLTLGGHTVFGGLRATTATGIPGEFLPRSVPFEISHFEARPELGECFLSYVRSTGELGQRAGLGSGF